MKISINPHTKSILVGQILFYRIRFLFVLVTLILSLANNSYSKNLYFSSSTGNDSYTLVQAQKPETPWKTIDKLNSSMSVINPGDSILFKRGDVFTGQISLTRSGTAGAYIVFSAYGTGNLPVIKGTLPITGWTRYSGNIWVADCPQLGSNVTNFFINGKSQQIGRYPNVDAPNGGYLNIDSHVGSTSITSSSLSSSPNWTGAEAVVRTRAWLLDRIVINSHSSNTIFFQRPTTMELINKFGFFIQNHLNTLDQDGEWYYNQTTKRIYLYFPSDPRNLSTEATVFESNVTMDNKEYLFFQKINFQGSMNSSISIKNSRHIQLINNTVSDVGNDAVQVIDCSYINFSNNEICRTNNNGLVFIRNNNAIIAENNIYDIGLSSGMNSGYFFDLLGGFYLEFIGIAIDGTNIDCSNNEIDKVGYHGIFFNGDEINVKHNFIKNFCMTLEDGGGIYTYNERAISHNNRRIEGNIILDGIGSPYGTNNPLGFRQVNGIYLDYGTDHVTVMNNTVANCPLFGVFNSFSHHNVISGNTLYNNKIQLSFSDRNNPIPSPVTDCLVENNIFYSKTDSQYVVEFTANDKDDIAKFGIFDNNYYCRPVNGNGIINLVYNGDSSSGYVHELLDLKQWQIDFNKDLSSTECPYTLPMFFVNSPDINRIVNGTFDKDISSWNFWSPYDNLFALWDNITVLDEGCLKLGFTRIIDQPDARLFVTKKVNEIIAGENYILKFSITSSRADKKMNITFRDDLSKKLIAPEHYINVDRYRNDYQLLFTADTSVTDARIDFVISEDSSFVWIDNVEFFKSKINLIATEDSILFLYNPTNTLVTIISNKNYKDVRGIKYTGDITLPPFSSIVLIQDVDTYDLPSIPLYVSSVIENSAPSKIEINYDFALANIIPTASAFSVLVNSVTRRVSSVSVSGAKVILDLSSPVAYGNTITLAYTKPSTNPIQTPAGGQAASLTSQTVTNKVAAPPTAPAIPAYVSSVIENADPSKIEITYNLALANIIPAASAFSVQVNSVTRSVSSVSVSGTKVILYLSSPVAYGNTITLAYAKPSINPIQTSAGGQAASLTSQLVTNRVTAPPVVVTPPVVVPPPVIPNTAPVPAVSYLNNVNSGFVSSIDASDSYDKEKDNLAFSWKIPGGVSVSSTTEPLIQFLAPDVAENQIYEFQVNVSDGKISQSKTVPVQIIPYQPELDTAKVISVEASNFKSPYSPDNVLDGNKGTMWSASGTDQWIILELETAFNIHHLKLAFQPGQKRESYFEIYGSNDKEKWEVILTDSKSCAFSGDPQVFDFPVSMTEMGFRYLKLTAMGNSIDTWNYISEFGIFGFRQEKGTDYEDQIVKIYPNPASELVNILIDEPTFFPDFIKVISLTGKVFYDANIDFGIRQLQIPIDFRPGIYIIQMGMDEITMFTGKIIVIQ